MVVVLPAPRKPPIMMKRSRFMAVFLEVPQAEMLDLCWLFYFIENGQSRPDHARVQPASGDRTDDWCNYINRQESSWPRPRQGDRAPSGQAGDQARAEIARRIETRLRQRRDHAD